MLAHDGCLARYISVAGYVPAGVLFAMRPAAFMKPGEHPRVLKYGEHAHGSDPRHFQNVNASLRRVATKVGRCVMS